MIEIDKKSTYQNFLNKTKSNNLTISYLSINREF